MTTTGNASRSPDSTRLNSGPAVGGRIGHGLMTPLPAFNHARRVAVGKQKNARCHSSTAPGDAK
jgi:hypothetical protein